jgi:hypothetical protein
VNVHRIVSGCRRLTVAGLLCSSVRVAAQRPGHSSIVLVSATVVDDRLSVAALRPIEFTVRRPGGPSTVQPTQPAAGEWRLIGTANAMIRMKLELPSVLVNSRDSTAVLAIEYAATAGRWRADVDDAAQATVFDPRLGASGRFGAGTDPALYVWLGGSIQSPTDTAGGSYEAAATLTLYYY